MRAKGDCKAGASPSHEEQNSGGCTLCQPKVHWLPNRSIVLSQSQIKTRLDTAYLECSSTRAMEQNLSSNAAVGPEGRGCVWMGAQNETEELQSGA